MLPLQLFAHSIFISSEFVISSSGCVSSMLSVAVHPLLSVVVMQYLPAVTLFSTALVFPVFHKYEYSGVPPMLVLSIFPVSPKHFIGELTVRLNKMLSGCGICTDW